MMESIGGVGWSGRLLWIAEGSLRNDGFMQLMYSEERAIGLAYL